MSDSKSSHPVQAIRTFSDDVKKVRGIKTEKEIDSDVELKVKPEKEDNTKNEEIKSPKIVLPPIEKKEPEKNADSYLTKNSENSTPQIPEKKQAFESEKIIIPKSNIQSEVETIGMLANTQVLGEGGVFEEDEIGSGSIVQDKRVRKFKLLPSMAKATKNWIDDRKYDLEESRKPEYTMTKAEARLDVIKKATERSKNTPTEDYESVAKRMKSLEREVSDSAVTVREKSEVPEPSWTYISDEEKEEAEHKRQDLLNELETAAAENKLPKNEPDQVEKPITQNTEPATTQQYKQSDSEVLKPKWLQESERKWLDRAGSKVEHNVEANGKKVVPEDNSRWAVPKKEIENPKPIPKISKESTINPPVREQTAHTTAPVISSKPKTFEPELKTYDQNLESPPATPTVSTDTTVSNKTKSLKPIEKIVDIPIYVIVLVIVAICGLGVLLSVFMFASLFNNEEEVIINTTNSNLIKSEVPEVSASFSNNHSSLINTLDTLRNERAGIRVVSFVNADVSEEPSSEEILNALLPNLTPETKRNINEVAIGFIDNDSPFIILRGNNYDSLFGGLLASEANLSRDLVPLFGTASLNTIFVDELVDDKGARILYDNKTEENLAYVFLNKNTVAIVTKSINVITLTGIINK